MEIIIFVKNNALRLLKNDVFLQLKLKKHNYGTIL